MLRKAILTFVAEHPRCTLAEVLREMWGNRPGR
jgi:hypothetical protein